MNKYQKSFIDDGASFLMHYNHNHDPKTGRFAQSTLFVSGSSKTQSKDSEYFRKKLPKQVRKELKEAMRNRDKIVVGDAPGIDRQVQDYLKSKGYKDVEVYGPGKQVRYSSDPDWKTKAIDSKYPEGSKEWLAEKDKVMSKIADRGLAITLDEGSRATRNNIDRLSEQGKDVSVFQLSKEGKRKDAKLEGVTLDRAWEETLGKTIKVASDNLRYDLKNNEPDLFGWREAYRKGYLEETNKKTKDKYKQIENKYRQDYYKKYDRQLNMFVDDNGPAKKTSIIDGEKVNYKQDTIEAAYDYAVNYAIYHPTILSYDEEKKKKRSRIDYLKIGLRVNPDKKK